MGTKLNQWIDTTKFICNTANVTRYFTNQPERQNMTTATEATQKALHVPRITSEGTGRAQLTAAYEVALDALANAFRAVRDIAPQRRDYTQDDDALAHAQQEHRSRLLSLNNLQNEIDAILDGIDKNQPITTAQVDA